VHRAVLEACLPCLGALIVAFVAVAVVLRASGAKWDLCKLRGLHGCERGGVQSLSFVVTLPFFLVIVTFIVQVSQLMIGVMVVHYAAFAAARSAVVWIPAALDDLEENKLPPPISTSNPLVLVDGDDVLETNYKYRKVFSAAAMACAPISPSRDLGFSLTGQSRATAAATTSLYSSMNRSSQSNRQIPRRLQSKLAYSFANTAVRIAFVDKDTQRGPTYNPRVLVEDLSGLRDWDRHEIGWQDPVMVTVSHNFALLPGPGRFLAKQLVRGDGQPDRISPRIDSQRLDRGRLFTTMVWASATMTNEGFKSIAPYVQEEF